MDSIPDPLEHALIKPPLYKSAPVRPCRPNANAKSEGTYDALLAVVVII